jgi:Condensation domain
LIAVDSDVFSRISKLSPEKLSLLSQRLRERREILQPIQRGCRDDKRSPLSFAQESLWFLHQMDPGGSAYNIPLAVELRGRLDRDALQKSLSKIADRHQILRATFQWSEGNPVQVIGPAEGIVAGWEDLSDEQVPNRMGEWIEAKIRQPFDLERGPLLRVFCGALGDERHILIVVMHHIVSDAWSMKIFVEELVALYQGHTGIGGATLPELPIQFADFAVWQRGRLDGASFQRDLNYWKSQLRGILALPLLPTDFPRTAGADNAISTFSDKLPDALMDRFRGQLNEAGITLFVGFLTAFQITLHCFTGREDLVIGSPMTGRFRPELQRQIGLFASIAILRTSLSGNPTFRELLRRSVAVLSGAQDHQDVPFRRLVEELRPTREPGNIPLFQVTMTFSPDPNRLPRIAGMEFIPLTLKDGTAMYDLDLNVVENEYGVTTHLEYRKALFHPATIGKISRAFGKVISLASENPELRLADLQQLVRNLEEQEAATCIAANKEIFRAKIATMKRKAVSLVPH